MTTTSQIRIATVDEQGNLESELTLEQLAAQVAALLPPPAPGAATTAPPNPPYLMTHHKAAEAADGVYDLNADETPAHFLYAETKGKTYTVNLQTVVTSGVLEVPVYLWGPGQFVLPQVTKWGTDKPQAGEEGWLVAILHFYGQKPAWTGFWAPVV